MKISQLMDFLGSTQKFYGNMEIKTATIEYEKDDLSYMVVLDEQIREFLSIPPEPKEVREEHNKANNELLSKLDSLIKSMRFAYDSASKSNFFGQSDRELNYYIIELEKFFKELEGK